MKTTKRNVSFIRCHLTGISHSWQVPTRGSEVSKNVCHQHMLERIMKNIVSERPRTFIGLESQWINEGMSQSGYSCAAYYHQNNRRLTAVCILKWYCIQISAFSLCLLLSGKGEAVSGFEPVGECVAGLGKLCNLLSDQNWPRKKSGRTRKRGGKAARKNWPEHN